MSHYRVPVFQNKRMTTFSEAKAILKRIPHFTTIWFPFSDTGSMLIRMACSSFHGVTYSPHYAKVQFYKYLPPACDYIIAEAPEGKLNDILARLNTFKKPYAVLYRMTDLLENLNKYNPPKGIELLYLEDMPDGAGKITRTMYLIRGIHRLAEDNRDSIGKDE